MLAAILLVLRLAMSVEELAATPLVLRLAMPATNAVEELAVLGVILLVMRLAMLATGTVYNLIGVETGHACQLPVLLRS